MNSSLKTSRPGFIRRNLIKCDKKFKETDYISLVRSVLDYSSTIWDLYHPKDINRIENIQRRAAIFVQGDYKRTSSVTSTMDELDWYPCMKGDEKSALPCSTSSSMTW